MADQHTITIGQGPGVDITIDDPYASAVHCRITQRPDGTRWIEDLGSTNGTWIIRDGLTIRSSLGFVSLLRKGDKVRIGRTTLPWEEAG